jgi:hypothetical protein
VNFEEEDSSEVWDEPTIRAITQTLALLSSDKKPQETHNSLMSRFSKMKKNIKPGSRFTLF